MDNKYANLLSYIASNSTGATNGKTILGIWDDQEHLNDWLEMKKDDVKGCKVITVPSRLLPIEIDANKDDVIIIGIAIGKKEDYSDVVLVYSEYGSL